MNTAFVILKPDCAARGLIGEVIKRFENRGFNIIKMEMRRKSEKWARVHYGHLPQVILEMCVIHMSDTRLIGILLQGPDNIVRMSKKMVGPTDSADAEPGTIRGDFGTNPIRFNIIHCADYSQVDCESRHFFDTETDHVC